MRETQIDGDSLADAAGWCFYYALAWHAWPRRQYCDWLKSPSPYFTPLDVMSFR